MACKKTLYVLAILLWALLPVVISPTSYAKNIHSHELPPDKAKVIVTFEGDIQPSTVEKYGQVLKTLKIINGLVAVIDRDDIGILQSEDGIKNVAIDTKISIIPPPARQSIEYPLKALGTFDTNEVLVGWNLQEPGIAVSDTPPPPDPPTSTGAWSTYSVDGSGVIIAILDTGVNYNLEDLNAPNYLGGYDFYNDDDDPVDDNWDPPDEWGHGTVVSTIAIAQGEEKIKGVAPNASYYALKVMGSEGTGDVSIAIEALDWCVNTANPKPDIVNMSLGLYDQPGNPFWPYIKQDYEEACNNAYNADIILIAGSGNDGVTDPFYPSDFENVISAGGHDDDQELYVNSNGGVDIIAPGANVPSMDMSGEVINPETGQPWRYFGTSGAAPHIAGLIALELQYAIENYVEINNGYQWESVKHSAIDLGLDELWQGKGKARALESIDLIASNWPIDYKFEFSDYAFIDANIPVYQIGQDVNQTIILTNITDTFGNYPEDIENLDVNAVQVYYGVPNEPNLPGYSIEVFPTITLLEPNDANSITLSLLYTILPETTPGLVKTKLEFEFNFVGNDRVIKVSYNEPNSFWYAAIPGDLDIEDDVDFVDYSRFAQQWAETDCHEPDWCNRADIDQSGNVNWRDLDILAYNWLTGL